MKNENEIKRAFAMEVIEKLEDLIEERNIYESNDIRTTRGIAISVDVIESLLPKEEANDSEIPNLSEATPEMQADFKRNNPEMKLTDTVLTESEKQLIEEAFKNTEKSVMIKPEPKTEIVEPETKTESDEVKVGDEVEYRGDKSYQLICNDMRGVSWILKNGQGFGQLVLTEDLKKVQPTKSQEEMDEEKIFQLICEIFETDEVSYSHKQRKFYLELINYGRKKK